MTTMNVPTWVTIRDPIGVPGRIPLCGHCRVLLKLLRNFRKQIRSKVMGGMTICSYAGTGLKDT